MESDKLGGQATTPEPSSVNREPAVQWPATDDKRWESFDNDLDKILHSTLVGDVQRIEDECIHCRS